MGAAGPTRWAVEVARVAVSWRLFLILCLLLPVRVSGAEEPDVRGLVRAEDVRAVRVARQLWDWSELGYLERRSSQLLQRELASAGFSIEAPVAGLPTAFIASIGQGWRWCSSICH